jgi:hypothetical protein
VNFLRFQIRHPNGQVEQLQVEAERVLIGTGAHCEIRLPLDQAALESVLIQRSAGGVYAQALSFEPPPTINNTPFSQAPLQAESVLGIGQVQIYVSMTDAAQGGRVVAKKQQKSNPILLLLCLLAALGGGYFILADQPTDGATLPPKAAPELWDPPVTACPQGGTPEQSIALARDKESIADARRERRPFHVQDGVAAVPLYETAASCFRQGGDQGSANESLSEAAALRKEMSDDFKTHQVRLEHSLSVQDLVTARREVHTLLAFLEGRQGDYITWLSNLDRRLKLKVGRQT